MNEMVDITERLRLNATDWIFGDTAITALKEINTLRQRVAELEGLIDLDVFSLAESNDLLRQRVAELEMLLAEAYAEEWEQEYYKVSKERDALKKLYESSEESVLALKETRNRLAEERDALKQQRDNLVEAATMAVEMIEYEKYERRHVRWKLLDAIASVKEMKWF